MSDTGKTCRNCKQSKPLSSFHHQRFPQRITTSCLDCRSVRRPTASTASPAPPVVAALPVPPSLAPPVPPFLQVAPAPVGAAVQPALPAPATTQDFVTRADLTSSLGELRQFLQDEVLHAVQAIASAVPQPATAAPSPPQPHVPAASPTPAPPAPLAQTLELQQRPALPAHSGEYQPAVQYPWISAELADRVRNDALSIYELPKLASPSWSGIPEPEDDTVIVEGVKVTKTPSTASSNKQFLKAVPNFATFGRLWVVYLTIRASSSPDRDLPISLGRFYQHIADLQEVFPWAKVADYIVAVCSTRLGKATSVEWARFENELHATHFQGLASRNAAAASSPSSAVIKRPPPRSDDPRREQVCLSWNNGKCTGTADRPCIRKHICFVCKGSHTLRSCTRAGANANQQSKPTKQD